MKNKYRLILAVALWCIVLGLGFWLYKIIQEPIEYQAEFNKREKATIDRLKNVRVAQAIYLEAKGVYADNFDDLINAVKFDSVMTIKTIGDPNDTTVLTTYDTIMEPILTVIKFETPTVVDSLRYVPHSGGQEFDIDARIKEVQRIKVPVFQVVASTEKYLKGLPTKFSKFEKDLVLGSLEDASDSGNWE